MSREHDAHAGPDGVSCPDNGPAYRSVVHALACRALGLKHSRTRPYRPQTNGKAERFIRTMLGGWAYGAIYGNSEEWRRALDGWLEFYNRRRPHGSLGRQPPVLRLQALRNNVAGSYTQERPRATFHRSAISRPLIGVAL